MEEKTELQPYSVLMSVYSGENADFFAQSLESLYIQTYPADEIVLVCDGALNKALDKVIAGYSEKFSGRLKVHRLESHGGTAKCANTGLALCKNEYIMKMDSDDICLEDRAVEQMTYLANHPEVSILGSYIQEFDSNTGEDIAIRKPPAENDKIRKFAKRRAPFNNQTLIYKKSLALSIGGYSEELERCEDYDFMVRMLIGGAVAANIPEVLVRYRVTSGNLNRRRNWRNTRSFIAVRKKIRKMGFSSFIDFLIPCAGQIALFIIPGCVTGFIYKKLLRK